MIAFAMTPQAQHEVPADAVARIAAGDERALELIVAAHGARLRASIARVLFALTSGGANDDDVDDAFSMMLVEFWRKAGQYAADPDVSPVGLLFGFARMSARRTYGRMRARSRRERPMDIAFGPLGPDYDIRTAAPDPEDWTSSLSFPDLVSRAVSQLPTGLRVAVTLVHIDGLSVQQAARRLHLSENQVRSRVAAGRRALADRLQPYRYHWTRFDGDAGPDALAGAADDILTAVMLYLSEHPDASAEEVRDHVAVHVGIRLNVPHIRTNFIRRARGLLALARAGRDEAKP